MFLSLSVKMTSRSSCNFGKVREYEPCEVVINNGAEDKGKFMYIIFRIFSVLLSDRLRITTEALAEARQEIEGLKSANQPA